MDEEMLAQIQQMLTTATDSLRQDFRQDMAALESRLGGRMEGMALDLGERIEEAKRHSGVLAEDLHHKLDLVIEGQHFLRQDIANVRSEMDAQTSETRALMAAAYRDLDHRVRHL